MKDQVGNLRMTFTGNGSTAQVLQNDDYYPFGNTFNSSLSSGARNNWLFNGMEWNENTVNTYDFHARMYDPQIGRSFQLDPLGDMFASVSPYSFLMNNPLMYTDPTGMTAETKEETGDGEGYFDDMGPITTLYSGSWFINSGKAYRGAGGFLAAFNPRGQYLREKARERWYRYVMVEKFEDTYTYNNYYHTLTYQYSTLKSRYFEVEPIYSEAQGGGGDGDNWLSNAGTAIGMGMMWATGYRLSFGAGSHYENDAVAGAMRNAHGVNQARDYFYNKYKGATSLKGASVTNYGASFGLSGLLRAGIDPIEQFIGSYTINMSVVNGNMLQYTLTNNSSFTSFFYGFGPSWNGGPMGNFNQTYIFTEPLNFNRLK